MFTKYKDSMPYLFPFQIDTADLDRNTQILGFRNCAMNNFI